MFLILGGSNSITNRIYAKLKVRGQRVAFWDAKSFPAGSRLAGDESTPAQGYWALDSHSRRRVPLAEIEGAYWWFYDGITMPAAGMQSDDPGRYYTELESCLLNFLHNLDCFWINPPRTVFEHRFKGEHLALARRLGFTIPDTLIANDPDAIRAFFDRHDGDIIFKSVSSTGVPEKMEPEYLDSDDLLIPQMYQQFIPGTDVRVHLVNDEIFATEVHSDHWVSKRDILDPKPLVIPDDVAEKCIALRKALGLVLAGIDFRKTLEGRYYFLEANPSPQFQTYEDRARQPISDCLVDALIAGGRSR